MFIGGSLLYYSVLDIVIMKWKFICCFLGFFLVISITEAQILKGFGKKVEQKVINRIDRKAEKAVDKSLDKAESEADKSVQGAVKKPKDSSKEKVPRKKESFVSYKKAEASIPSKGFVLNHRNCADMVWFEQGASLSYQIKDDNGKDISTTSYHIQDVWQENEKLISTITASSDQVENMELQYVCDGDQFYIDFKDLFESVMKSLTPEQAAHVQFDSADIGTEIDLGDGYLGFPNTLYQDQELDPMRMSVTAKVGGSYAMEMNSSLEDRVVIGLEKVRTAAGDFECVKVAGRRYTSFTVMGMNQEMEPAVEYIWIAPKVGMVKQELYDEKGGIQTTLELIEFK